MQQNIMVYRSCGVEATIQRHFSPNWNVFFLSLRSIKGPKEYYRTLLENFHLKVSLCLEYEAPKLVKVKAHKRLLNGKVVKVRSYYRRVWGRR